MKNKVGSEDPAGNAKQPPSVQTMLAWLVLACLLPGVLGAMVLLQRGYQSERQQLQERTLQTARALVHAVDAPLMQAQQMAMALATSGSLGRRDLAAFHQRAKALVGQGQFALSVLLYDAQGQQLLNTRIPYGQPLPTRANLH